MRVRFARFFTSRATVGPNKFSVADCVTCCSSRFSPHGISKVSFSQGPKLGFAIGIIASLAIVFVNSFNVLRSVMLNFCLYTLSAKVKVSVAHSRMRVKRLKR
jgi:hypothetical protein